MVAQNQKSLIHHEPKRESGVNPGQYPLL